MATSELTRLALAIDRHTLGRDECVTAIPGLRLYRLPVPWDFPAVVYEPTLYVVARGAKEVRFGGMTYRYDPAQMLLVSVDLPVSARVTEASPRHPCLVAHVKLETDVVTEILAGGHSAPPPPDSKGLALTPADPNLLDALGRLIRLLDSPGEIGPLSPLILREIAYRVLVGPQGSRLCQIATAKAPVRRIANAIRWLKDHFARSENVESLAHRARMSPSSFHLHFKAVTGLSPLQYQKRLRLQEARRLMLGEGLDAAAAAYRVGYESPSQFSREYRRLFGTSPRRDVETIKAA